MNDLPLDYTSFANQMGYTAADQWDASKGGMKKGWSRIHRQVADGKRIDGLIRDFIGRMSAAQDRLSRARKLQVDNRDSKRLFSLFESLYPQHIPVPAPPSPPREKKPIDPVARAAKRKKKKERKNNKPYGTVTIGLGLESTFKPRKIKRESVVIDAHTQSTATHEKSIVYAAGWSINGAFDDKL